MPDEVGSSNRLGAGYYLLRRLSILELFINYHPLPRLLARDLDQGRIDGEIPLLPPLNNKALDSITYVI